MATGCGYASDGLIDRLRRVTHNWPVDRFGRLHRLALLMGMVVLALAGCTAVVGTGAPTPRATPVPGSVAPTTAALSTAQPSPTLTPTPAPPTATAVPAAMAPTATATALPMPTPPDPAAGLDCPADDPVKPDYARGGVGATPLQPAGADTTWPHQWLAGPVAVDGLPRVNRNYPYGADSNGRYLLHNGLDVVEPAGDTVLAVADGTVIVAGTDDERLFGWRCSWYGHLVVIELDQTWDGQPIYVLYGHVVDLVVAPGERVRAGDALASIGIGGVATAPHLHLEVRVGRNEFGSTRNPDLWLAPVPGFGTIAGRLVDPDGRPWQGVGVTLIDLSGRSGFVNSWTYLDDPEHLIHPDEAAAENFTFGFVPEGDYVVYAQVQGQEYRQPVAVQSGAVATVEIVTAPYQTATPTR